ncbi:related to RKM4 - ribosomal lysine methyltransferase [Ustilago trichophora]|uniref:Related to RKM4 - ribosomal lysine methyltransferase n=1 Tax=Ustilago trichophora TaxID=86804 RepID=A0A5C3EAS3_9BASI|nr:related to RKM4 - ribosomal lysine methyltransferase [Ustilago trichophora]
MADSNARQTTSEVEAAFLRWFRQSGGALDSRCHIQPIPGMGRGMIANQPIAAGETIFTIPRHILLNLATSTLAQRCTQAEASSSTASTYGSRPDGDLTWNKISKMGWLPLILAMMFERRRAAYLAPSSTSNAGAADDGDVSMENLEASTSTSTTIEQLEGTNAQGAPFRDAPRPHGQQTWGAYFDIMPTQFTTPMFWTQNDLTHLAGTSIADKIARDEAEADYHNTAIPFIQSLPQVFLEGVEEEAKREQEVQKWYSLETYHIMGSRILSRSFHVKSRKKGLEGKTVDMDDLDGDDDEDESEAEVLEDEGEAENEEEAPEAGSGDEADETKDEDEQDQDADDDDLDSDTDDDSDEEEQENVIDISMTPMADMLNARFESDNARLFYKSHILEMRATKPISPGEQIFNTYADPPNSDLLRRYGHVDEPNGSDVVELDAKLILTASVTHLSSLLSLSVEELKKDLEERLEWACSSLGIDEVFILNYLFTPSAKKPHRAQPEKPTPKELKSAATGGGIPEEMIALTRILCQSRETFEKARSKGKGPSARIEAQEEHLTSNSSVKISPSQIMMEAIDLRLNQYPNGSSVQEEEAKLYGTRQSEVEGENERRALVVRLGEKRVLLDQKRVLKYVLDRINEAEAAKNVKSKTGKDAKRKGGANGKAPKDDGKKKQRR